MAKSRENTKKKKKERDHPTIRSWPIEPPKVKPPTDRGPTEPPIEITPKPPELKPPTDRGPTEPPIEITPKPPELKPPTDRGPTEPPIEITPKPTSGGKGKGKTQPEGDHPTIRSPTTEREVEQGERAEEFIEEHPGILEEEKEDILDAATGRTHTTSDFEKEILVPISKKIELREETHAHEFVDEHAEVLTTEEEEHILENPELLYVDESKDELLDTIEQREMERVAGLSQISAFTMGLLRDYPEYVAEVRESDAPKAPTTKRTTLISPEGWDLIWANPRQAEDIIPQIRENVLARLELLQYEGGMGLPPGQTPTTPGGQPGQVTGTTEGTEATDSVLGSPTSEAPEAPEETAPEETEEFDLEELLRGEEQQPFYVYPVSPGLITSVQANTLPEEMTASSFWRDWEQEQTQYTGTESLMPPGIGSGMFLSWEEWEREMSQWNPEKAVESLRDYEIRMLQWQQSDVQGIQAEWEKTRTDWLTKLEEKREGASGQRKEKIEEEYSRILATEEIPIAFQYERPFSYFDPKTGEYTVARVPVYKDTSKTGLPEVKEYFTASEIEELLGGEQEFIRGQYETQLSNIRATKPYEAPGKAMVAFGLGLSLPVYAGAFGLTAAASGGMALVTGESFALGSLTHSYTTDYFAGQGEKGVGEVLGTGAELGIAAGGPALFAEVAGPGRATIKAYGEYSVRPDKTWENLQVTGEVGATGQYKHPLIKNLYFRHEGLVAGRSTPHQLSPVDDAILGSLDDLRSVEAIGEYTTKPFQAYTLGDSTYLKYSGTFTRRVGATGIRDFYAGGKDWTYQGLVGRVGETSRYPGLPPGTSGGRAGVSLGRYADYSAFSRSVVGGSRYYGASYTKLGEPLYTSPTHYQVPGRSISQIRFGQTPTAIEERFLANIYAPQQVRGGASGGGQFPQLDLTSITENIAGFGEQISALGGEAAQAVMASASLFGVPSAATGFFVSSEPLPSAQASGQAQAEGGKEEVVSGALAQELEDAITKSVSGSADAEAQASQGVFVPHPGILSEKGLEVYYPQLHQQVQTYKTALEQGAVPSPEELVGGQQGAGVEYAYNPTKWGWQSLAAGAGKPGGASHAPTDLTISNYFQSNLDDLLGGERTARAALPLVTGSIMTMSRSELGEIENLAGSLEQQARREREELRGHKARYVTPEERFWGLVHGEYEEEEEKRGYQAKREEKLEAFFASPYRSEMGLEKYLTEGERFRMARAPGVDIDHISLWEQYDKQELERTLVARKGYFERGPEIIEETHSNIKEIEEAVSQQSSDILGLEATMPTIAPPTDKWPTEPPITTPVTTTPDTTVPDETTTPVTTTPDTTVPDETTTPVTTTPDTTKPITVPDEITTPITVPDEITTPVTVPTETTTPVTTTTETTTAITTPTPATTPLPITPTIPNLTPKLPNVPKFGKLDFGLPGFGKEPKRKKARKPRTKTGFDVFMKRPQKKEGKGKYKGRGYEKINELPLTRAAAWELGATTADRYTNRSFKLKKSRKKAEKGLDVTGVPAFLERKFRKKKGDSKIFVEKTDFAIDSIEEKVGIPYKGQEARRKTMKRGKGLLDAFLGGKGKQKTKRSKDLPGGFDLDGLLGFSKKRKKRK